MTTLTPAIAFDLDDTLYHESDYVAACLRNVADTLPDSDLAFAAMSGSPNPFDALIAAFPDCPLTIDAFLGTYRATAPSYLPLRKDAAELLDRLHTAYPHIPLYLITDGRSAGQRNKIAALGLNKYFPDDHIVISGETGFDKTTPFPFATAIMRDGSPRHWFYIGDNPAKDFRWPNLMGWTTIMLRSPAGTTVHAQTLPADIYFHPRHTITDLNQVIPLLKK